jgi:hypothetical protein
MAKLRLKTACVSGALNILTQLPLTISARLEALRGRK